MSSELLVWSLYLPWFVLLGVVAQVVMPTGSQVVSKPLAWFKVNSNVRKHFDEASLRALGHDLRRRQISPLVCLADGTIICGERRYRAALLEGLAELHVIIVTDAITQAEHKRLQLAENLQRQDLSNSEKAEGCVNFAHCNPQMTFKEIAQALGVDPSLVTRWMSWERAIVLLREALACDSITLNTFYSIAQKPQEEQEAALREALDGKKSKGNGHSSAPRSRSKLLLPSGLEFTVVASELSLEGLRKGLRDLQRLADEAKDVETLCEAMKVAKSESVTDLDVLAKALRAAKENDQELDLRTLMTVAKGKKEKKAG